MPFHWPPTCGTQVLTFSAYPIEKTEFNIFASSRKAIRCPFTGLLHVVYRPSAFAFNLLKNLSPRFVRRAIQLSTAFSSMPIHAAISGTLIPTR